MFDLYVMHKRLPATPSPFGIIKEHLVKFRPLKLEQLRKI